MPLVAKDGEILLGAAVESGLNGARHTEIVPQTVLQSQPQRYPYSQRLRKNSSSLAVKKCSWLSGLRRK